MARDDVFERLRAILAQHRGRLGVLSDQPGNYELVLAPTAGHKRELWVAAVRNGKAYVSFHLMPVYAFPDLLADVSPELRKRMQGKSCFNFSRVDDPLFAELSDLTARGIERFLDLGADRLTAGR